MTGDEKFFAWLDGELDSPEAAEMEAKVASDPRLSRLAEQHRSLGARLSHAFDTVADSPVPERLVEPLRSRRTAVIDFAAKRDRRRSGGPPLPQWAAMAATLVVGVLVGKLALEPASSPIQFEDGSVYAAASLDRALDTQLASTPAGGDVRIGLTFRSADDSICRTFTAEAASGLACRQGDRWQMRGLFAAPEGQAGEYRMAAGAHEQLADMVDSTMTGEPFDAAQEQAARDQGWR